MALLTSVAFVAFLGVVRAALQSLEELEQKNGNIFFERQEAMSRVLGHLVMIAGCLISLISFCLLPYLAVSYSSIAFTGLQLITSGPLILLPIPHRVNDISPHFWLRNLPFIFSWVPLLLVALLLLAALGDLLLTLTGQSVPKAVTRVLLILASLTICFALCSLVSNLAAGFDMMSAHGDTINGIGRGTLFTPGFGGFLVGLVVALIGGMMTLLTKRPHSEMPRG